MLGLFDNSIVNAIEEAPLAAPNEPNRLTLAARVVTAAAHAPCESGCIPRPPGAAPLKPGTEGIG